MSGGRGAAGDEEDGSGAAATHAARARVVAALYTKHLTSTLVPVAVQLRRLLQARPRPPSPLLAACPASPPVRRSDRLSPFHRQ